MAYATTEKLCLHCGAPSGEQLYCCNACRILASNWGPLPVPAKDQNHHAYLDQKEFRDLYRQGGEADLETYTFYAEGMQCSSCIHLLEKLPDYDHEVASARVNYSQGTIQVELHSQGSLSQVAHVIEELGYKPSIVAPQEDVSQKIRLENRASLKRIAVAGFCAGNTMLFVIPVYSGLTGPTADLFNWLSFALFLPILLYAAVPFYRGAWSALRYKTVNVDLPISLAMLLGFALSTVNLIRGEGHIYFDSTASFMFFILSARYLLKRVQQNFLAPLKVQSYFKDKKFLRKTDTDTWMAVPSQSLQQGDVLKITRGQTLPAEGRLLSAHATLDMSLFNGESLPRIFSQGMELFAGTQCLDNEVEVELTGTFEESRLGKLLRELEEGSLLKSPFIALTDRLAQRLVITVFTIAALFFVAYAWVNPQEAFNRSLALIVLACPCALAFGSPLTYGMALKKAQKIGILLKDSSSLEKLLNVEHVFFDKTGTLTQGRLQISHSQPTAIPPELQKIILSLEAPSYHPIAFALRDSWSHPSLLHPVHNFAETLGKGVEGDVLGDHYEIRHLSESVHESELGIEVWKNGVSVARIYFKDELRKDAKDVIQFLKKKNVQSHLLSGDKKIRVQEAAQACGIPLFNTAAELFPEDKQHYLEKFKHTCMIGDGANDSLSLKKADVGIAVKGSVDLSLSSADIYFTRGGLRPFLDLLSLAQQTRTTLVRNFSISLAYNLIGGVLALLGFINPMLAAILMPLSSALIILSSFWGLK